MLLALTLLVACGIGPPALPTASGQGGPTPLPTIPPTVEPSLTAAALTPPSPTALAGLQGSITIDGSSTVFPITEAASIAFRRYAPQVAIQLGVCGTSGGFKKFCAGETLIANASRPITTAEAATCAQGGIAFVKLPIAFDRITVMVHPSNTWATCITIAELKTLWAPAAEEQVRRWQQVRVSCPATPITLYGAGADSGTYDYFTQAVVGQQGASRKDYTASEDDYLLAQDLAADPGGLGFFGYAYYVEYQGQLRAVALDNGNGCVAPSQATITDGSYQPLARPYVRADALAQPALRK